ncbi:Trm112 family protein [Streptomyces cavernicola]|uniref:Trm112 family protein n=1 Tax=Streptomyces cavernicola TaxID=3043613 RepID=A0ABT6SJA3_9ACTN|nr:Trm112 family protein [Streptomyces sp. B-S-A6]MDI3408273.1 Trm112 family protein [Streptomyces sp. B-S-A6]
MTPDDPLLKILACPLDKGPLHLLVPEEALYNPRLRRRYPLIDGIPQLLPSSGEQVADEEHERLHQRIEAGTAGAGAAGAGAAERVVGGEEGGDST